MAELTVNATASIKTVYGTTAFVESYYGGTADSVTDVGSLTFLGEEQALHTQSCLNLSSFQSGEARIHVDRWSSDSGDFDWHLMGLPFLAGPPMITHGIIQCHN